MKKLVVLSLCFAFLNIVCSENDNREIEFVVHSSILNDSELVFISGNDSILGKWNPGLVSLERINDSTWSREFWLQKGKNLEFKFTKGSWDYEALNSDGSIPGNNLLKVANDTSVYFQITKWRNREPRINHGQITGTVQYHLQFESDGLKPRDIIVWLPPSYFHNNKKRYPVLYMHDGQNVIDPATSSFGYDWRIDEVADSLIRKGLMEEIIIVGIYNTLDRRYEYTYAPLGYTYMDFIVHKLKPFIDSEYRTLPNPENTAIGGSSAGGLISMMMVWNYPNVFSKGACFSPAFKIQELNYVDTIVNYSGKKKNINFYIDNGGIGIDAELLPGSDEMITVLKNKGFKLGKDIIYYVDKKAAHFETAWAERIWRPLVFFFGRK